MPVSDGIEDLWVSIQDRVLPIFSGFGWKTSIEQLNTLVSKWVSETPVETIRCELLFFFKTGMVGLLNKLQQANKEAFCTKTGEVWVFFFGRVLPL
jgi:hypothetical protein